LYNTISPSVSFVARRYNFHYFSIIIQRCANILRIREKNLCEEARSEEEVRRHTIENGGVNAIAQESER
jgi:hypothetical protein